MDSCRISSLPDVLLVLILSYLSFKDKIKTSALSRRWRNLCYETKDIAFKESEYVDHLVSDNHSKRVSFVRYMTHWVSRVNSEALESFEICFSDPLGFKAEIESLIQFAVSKKVKKLILDFSSPFWRNTCDVLRLEFVVELPALVYSLETLESLKIYACGFEPKRFGNLGLLRKLSIGWFRLNEIQSMLSKCPSLESLSINYCWGIIDSMVLAGQIKEFVFENCSFPALISCSLNLPNLDIFKYYGDVINFRFENVNTILKEVYLDFGAEYTYDEPTYSNKDAGEILSQLLNDLRSTKTLTVCPYLLEVYF